MIDRRTLLNFTGIMLVDSLGVSLVGLVVGLVWNAPGLLLLHHPFDNGAIMLTSGIGALVGLRTGWSRNGKHNNNKTKERQCDSMFFMVA